MEDLIYKVSKVYNEVKTKVLNSSIVKFYKKYLYKPFHFIAKAISWTFFVILTICAAILVYYYVQLKVYEKNGAGSEPNFYLYTIISASMYPTIEVYDVVFVKSVDDPLDIEVGDVVSYNSSSFISNETISVTHRVTEIVVDKNGTYYYTTKGDNNLTADNNAVTFDQIEGVVMFKIPQLGRLQAFLGTMFGWMLIIVIPALLIIIKYVAQLLKLNVVFAKIPKNSKFFPIFNKPLSLPFSKQKYLEYKDNNKIFSEITEEETIKVDEISKFDDIEKTIKTEEENKIDNQQGNNGQLNTQDDDVLIDIDIDNIFEDFKNLRK